MEKTESHADQAESAPRHRWPRALLSGAVFGGLGAAAGHWLATQSSTKGSLRQWVMVFTGAFAGIIAIYGTLKSSAEAQQQKKVSASVQKASVSTEEEAVPNAASRMLLLPDMPDTKIASESAVADKLSRPEHLASL